ncbi:MAG: sulfatase-like hydrolase/transferase [Verrucomicrobiae bacterium]|nr:sulfatase-like hydrolase/transferase [Verrucomicrobiae bacterium]
MVTPAFLVGVVSAGLLLAPSFLLAATMPAASKPNILFILADDLGYGDLRCYGRDDVRTPVLDQLAADGVRLTQCYANGPECTPTRAAFMTGRYQQRVGGLECAIGTGNVGRYDDAVRLRETHDLGLPVEETSIARMLRDAGYATALCGKWHLGYEPKFAPNKHGFDHAFYCIGGGMDYFHHVETNGAPALYLDGKPIRREGYFTDLVTDDAIRFIERGDRKPFFLCLAYTAPHSPFQGPKDFRPTPLAADSPLQEQGKAPREVYVAMIERMDQCIGRVLDALDRRRLADNTVVIFTSDNGGTRSARNAPFSGTKGSTFEGGIRVPGIVRWPEKIPRGIVSEQVCITMDFTASILRVAGAQPPAGRKLDGIDVLQLLETNNPPLPRTLFWRQRRGDRTWWAVRDGTLKLVRQANGTDITENLFDLAADAAEKNDLLKQKPEEVARLKKLLAAWETDVKPRR